MNPEVFVLDIDGVLLHANQPLAGARELIGYFNSNQVPYYLMSNNPFISKIEKAHFFSEIGLSIPENQLMGSADPLAKVLDTLNISNAKVFSVCREDSSPILDLFKLEVTLNLEPHEYSAVILFDDDDAWNLALITKVFHILHMNPKIPFIVCNPDRIFPISPGVFMPTSGSIARWIMDLCSIKDVSIKPIYIGKPYEIFYSWVFEKIKIKIPNIKKSSVVMLGDTPATDICGANQFGWTSWLIETGNCKYGAGEKDSTPDRTFKDLPSMMRELRWPLS